MDVLYQYLRIFGGVVVVAFFCCLLLFFVQNQGIAVNPFMFLHGMVPVAQRSTLAVMWRSGPIAQHVAWSLQTGPQMLWRG